MDAAGEGPKIASGGPFPLIVFSHGYNVHPLHDIGHMAALASHGYIVACLFHGDGRFGSAPDYLILNQIRAATVREVIRQLGEDRHFGPAIDFLRVGGFGISLGGMTMMSLLGADDGRHPVGEPVIDAFFGESPALFPFDSAKGRRVSAVDRPVFVVLGVEDGLYDGALRVVRRLRGPKYFAKLPGQGHVPSEEARATVINTYALTFFDAHLKHRERATLGLEHARSVAGDIPNAVVNPMAA